MPDYTECDEHGVVNCPDYACRPKTDEERRASARSHPNAARPIAGAQSKFSGVQPNAVEAEYRGECTVCPDPIEVGDLIVVHEEMRPWPNGGFAKVRVGWRHVDC